jgi:multidrug resistance efflux pump
MAEALEGFMFFKRIPPVADATGRGGAPVPLVPGEEHSAWAKATAPLKPPLLGRAIKLSVAAAVLGIGAFALYSRQGYVASNNAVVSAELVSIRAPIDGIVSGHVGGVGTKVHRGETIAVVTDPWFDDQRLTDLRATLERLERQKKNAEDDKAGLIGMAAKLEERVSTHTKANAERLRGLVAEAEKALAALVARQNQAQFDVDRQVPLQSSGVVSRAEAQRKVSALEAAKQDTAAQQGRLASLRAEAEAATAGVLSSHGGIDVSYSAQRIDQITIEVANLTRLIADFGAEAETTAARLADEERRAARMREARLTAPVSGIVWRQGTSDGERIAKGDTAIEIVDCAETVLLVAVPQDRFADIELGGTAKFRLSGELVERKGKVATIMGQPDEQRDAHFAARPVSEPIATIIARVTMQPEENGGDACLVGRTARVLLPTSGGGPVDWVMRRLL